MAGVLIVGFLLLVTTGESAKILLVSVPMISHCMVISSVGEELVKRGHQVTIFLSSGFEHRQCFGTSGIRLMQFNPGPANKTMDDFNAYAIEHHRRGSEASLYQNIEQLKDFTWTFCTSLLWDLQAINRLKEEQFDLAITDPGGFLLYCQFVIPYLLNVPYVASSSYYEDMVIGRPFLPSISPSWLMPYTPDMDLFGRVANTINQLIIHLLHIITFPQDAIDRVAPELSRRDVVQLVSRSELFLQNYDPVLGYPLANFPNQIMVGGLTTGPAKSFSGELKTFYENSHNGVILVSFGSTFGKLPRHIKQRFLSAFHKLKIAILWKEFEENIDKNVKFVKWAPLNDLLGHPKTRLFVTHCGQSSLFETLYHAVPVVCTPVFGDQEFNAARVEYWTAGRKMDLLHSTDDFIYETVIEVLVNSTYRKNMRRASEIFHSRSENPRERAAFWVEHVLKFGGHHLRSESPELSVFSLLGYDVFSLLLAVFCVSAWVICRLTYWIYSCCVSFRLISLTCSCIDRQKAPKLKTS